jgi:hypothetical protein
MPYRFRSVTSSRFERRALGGRHDLAFQIAFGGDGRAARSLGISRMQVWRYRHDKTPLPRGLADLLTQIIRDRVTEAHLAETQLNDFRREPPRPPRRLTGCCEGYHRKPVKADNC